MTDGLLRDAVIQRTTQNIPGGSLNFDRFETENVGACVAFIQELIENSARINNVSIEEMRKGVKIMITGGGAHRFSEFFASQLQVEVRKEDEMECLIEGLKFITLIPDEVYYFSDELISSVAHPQIADSAVTPKVPSTLPSVVSQQTAPANPPPLERPGPDIPRYAVTFEKTPTPQLPCLLVNIGSGVSIIKVDEDGTFERVSGTSLGGGTLWGLLSLLTPAKTFDGRCFFLPQILCMLQVERGLFYHMPIDMLELCERGDNSTVDMLVRDIYGQDYNRLGLKSTIIASSFGKVYRKGEDKGQILPEDIGKSLLYAVSNNIGQIA